MVLSFASPPPPFPRGLAQPVISAPRPRRRNRDGLACVAGAQPQAIQSGRGNCCVARTHLGHLAHSLDPTNLPHSPPHKHVVTLEPAPALDSQSPPYRAPSYTLFLTQCLGRAGESSEEASGSDEDVASWISWFCSLKGNEFFCEVEEDFIQDDFNLSGLSSLVSAPC